MIIKSKDGSLICRECKITIHPVLIAVHLWTSHQDVAERTRKFSSPFEYANVICPKCRAYTKKEYFKTHMRRRHSIKVPFDLKADKDNKNVLQKEILNEEMIRSKWQENQCKL